VIAWTIANPDISAVIIGVSKPEQLAEQIRATDVTLPPDLKKELDSVWFALPRRPPENDPKIADFYAEV